MLYVFFFKQKTAYEMRISDWSSDVCSSDLLRRRGHQVRHDVSHKLLNGVARSQTSHSLFGRRIGPGDRSPGPISRLGRRQARGPAGPQGLYQVPPPSSAAPAAASLSALSTTPTMLSSELPRDCRAAMAATATRQIGSAARREGGWHDGEN